MIKILLALIVLTTSTYGQGLINAQPGSGVPTDMAIGGLLGAIIAPMISKGSDAKLVGGLLGATAGGMYGTANNQIRQQQQSQMAFQQDQQMRYVIQQQQMQLQAMQNQINQMAQINTAGGNQYRDYNSGYNSTGLGTHDGRYVRSPYSRFRIEPKSMGLQTGDVIYDPFTGKPFRLP